ncbi:hypothetical protein [Hymenobacter edaphi]|uniref:PKD domain-containing protein n=1 Tax=Hymenobacter edaphi TaxID=2211146 RepID=A0A328BST1_9BACT|nr:hypothetical protein [Hymenobacter edaphi]RAK70332.1 hypothetical protein DLM85_05670 [Hymenobacter edaphi]
MRKIYLCVALLWLGLTSAWATTPPDSLRLRLDYLFAPLDKSQVPTGCLAEYATPLLTLAPFAGALTDSSLTNAQAWRMLYATWGSSRLAGSSALPGLEDVDTRWDAAQTAAPASIPVAVQRLDYATLRPDALTAGLLTVQNEQFHDVAGRSQSPYLRRTLFAAAPLRSYDRDGVLSLIFPSNLHLRTSGYPTALQVDFGDGNGYVPAARDQPIEASYTTEGAKRIKVRVTYSSSAPPMPGSIRVAAAAPQPTFTVLESWFDVQLNGIGCAGCRYDLRGDSVLFSPTIDRHEGAIAFIRYGGNHTPNARPIQLVKPLIVVEGYDVSGIASKFPNLSIRDFLDDIDNDGPFNLRNALDNGALGTIGNYDIVYIDFLDGTDDIRRNAAAFEKVVRWVNQHKVPATPGGPLEPNVVLGISMGGLVARYGLAEMTKRGNDDPQTRQFVTWDSPHRGANTPLGVQSFTRAMNHFLTAYTIAGPAGGIALSIVFPQIRQLKDVLEAPLSRQLLLQYATNANGGYATNTFLDGEYRSMITFGPGDPVPGYTFKAASLGSQCGTDNGLQSYHELARLESGMFLTPLPSIGRSDLRVQAIINSVPNFGGAQRISLLKLYAKYRILGVSVQANLFREAADSPPNVRDWDRVPGGLYNVAGYAGIEPTAPDPFNWRNLFGFDLRLDAVDAFCFVPTFSALDVPEQTNASIFGVYANGGSSARRPLAERFIAQGPLGGRFNQFHPTFNARNSEWLFREIQNLGPAGNFCTLDCNPFPDLRIAGDELICASGPNSAGHYTIANLPAGATVNWYVDPPGALTPTGPSTGPAFDVQYAGPSAADVTIRANVGFCGTPLAFPVAIGQGRLDIEPMADPVCAGDKIIADARTVGVGSTARYTWKVDGVVRGALTGSHFVHQLYDLNATGSVLVEVSVADDCGGLLTAQRYVQFAPCPGPTAGRYAVYPNPAADDVTVEESQQAAFQATL